MSFLVKRLSKINVSLKTSVLIFFSMRVGPVRVTIWQAFWPKGAFFFSLIQSGGLNSLGRP